MSQLHVISLIRHLYHCYQSCEKHVLCPHTHTHNFALIDINLGSYPRGFARTHYVSSDFLTSLVEVVKNEKVTKITSLI